MTNDFKEKILKWFVGDYNISTGNNIPIFDDVETSTASSISSLFDYGYFVTGVLQGQDINNNGVSYMIIYGTYFVDSDETELKGFIAILDEKGVAQDVIKQYSSGTLIDTIEILNVGDDGNFYGIENVNGTKRFIMLNNIIAKEPNSNYQLVLRQSYNLSGQSANIIYFSNILKAPERSRYLIVGNDSNLKTIATELEVKVGDPNVWTDYVYNSDFAIGDVFANWDTDNNLTFTIAGFTYSNIVNLVYAELLGNSQNGTNLTLVNYGNEFQNAVSFGMEKINFNETYFCITTDDTGTNYGNIYIYRIKAGVIELIKDIQTVYDTLGNESSISLYKINNEVFYVYNHSYPYNTDWTITVGKLIDNNYYEKDIVTNNVYTTYQLFMVTKQFDLYNYYVRNDIEGTSNANVYNVKQIYNSLNYNGSAYQGLNSMIPNVGVVLSNNEIVFARNLYNRTVTANTTTSTLNVPKEFINNITLDKQQLYGMTNNLLNDESVSIETNIYEELMINFINTLLISNQNDSNNIIQNINGSIRLNNSISNLLDYENAKMTKYKVNYDDGFYIIGNLDNSNLVYNNLTTQLKLIIYLPNNRNIENVELLSNDENTIYQTIDCSSLKNKKNKYYQITQDLKIV